MGKKLSEMSLEELWQLFPIFLTRHQPVWEDWYKAELTLLTDVLPASCVHRISHIGSTSVSTIWAKPIIDILVEISLDCDLEPIREILLDHGYQSMSEDYCRMSLNKGYTENGFEEKVFHLHLRYTGDNDELYFRDYLLEHPETAADYEKLKLGLWKKFEYNRNAYTDSKTEFINRYTEIARRLYKNRYSA